MRAFSKRFLAATLGLASAAAIAVPAAAQDAAAPIPAPAPAPAAQAAPLPVPRLVLAISVDQFSGDLFAQYRRRFSAGLARLQEGAVFPSGFQGHAATETCPGHSTLLTGARPARTGIIANNWYDPGIARADKRIYCSENERDPASSSKEPVVSAWHLKVPTLGERMKQRDRATRNVAVSAKDRSVVMMGGQRIDAGYWWKNGAFTALPGRKLSPAALAANERTAAVIKAGSAALAVPSWCVSRDREINLGKRSVGNGHFALPPGTEYSFRASPGMDAAVGDLALALVDEMKLGKGRAPDMLSVSFSATDYIGHAMGTEGVEMCIQMDALDKIIGKLLDGLDARGIDYAVVLSADHGGVDLPERLKQQGLVSAGRVGDGLDPDELTKAVRERTGITAAGPLVYGDGGSGDFYVSRTLSQADRASAAAALAEITRAHPQVEAVFTSAELAAAPMPSASVQDWTLLERARASFDAQRSGDVVVMLNRAIVPIKDPNGGTTHGSPWDYDRRVPILFLRKGLTGLEQPAPVETVDIAPTLAALIGLEVPAGAFDGRCLDIDGGAADICQPAK